MFAPFSLRNKFNDHLTYPKGIYFLHAKGHSGLRKKRKVLVGWIKMIVGIFMAKIINPWRKEWHRRNLGLDELYKFGKEKSNNSTHVYMYLQ